MIQFLQDAADELEQRAAVIEAEADRFEEGTDGDTFLGAWARFGAAWVRLGAALLRTGQP